MERRNDFTKGSIPGAIMRLAMPMIGAQIVNALYSMVDKMFIARLPEVGTLAMSGVGLTLPLILLVSAFAMLAGMGGAPLCSIARGAEKDEEAERIMGTSFAMLLVLGLGLTCLVLPFRIPLLVWFGATEEVLPFADEYISTYLLGSVFVMVTLGMNPFINSQGFSRTGMLTVVIGAALNIALDPLFMFVLGMGVRGAALATIIAQAVSAGWVLAFLTGKRCILRLKRENIRLSLPRVKKIAALGASTCVMNITDAIVSFAFNRTLAEFGGVTYLGVMTVIGSVRQVLMMPVTGFGQGMQPVMGYNYGAGRYDRVRECFLFTLKASAAYTLVITLCTQFFPELFFRLFKADETLLTAGGPALRLYFSMFYMLTLQIAGQYAFVALGQSRQAIFFSLLRKAFIVAPVAMLLPRVTNLGVMGVFAAEPISDFVGSSACFITFMLTMWRRLRHPPEAGEEGGHKAQEGNA